MKKEDRINQNQFFELITSEELSWQSIIYDLIKTEQLDPWDINLAVLADRYVETLTLLEEANFFVSSKVLLACSLLLRLKSTILVNEYIQELNDVLYGKKEIQSVLNFEEFEIDENDLPTLVPKTPLARNKKVTIDELMKALNHAMNTENRRIKRHIKTKQAEKSALVVLPKKHIPLKIRIKNIYNIISNRIENLDEQLMFHHLAKEKEEQLASFLPVLHLSNEQQIYLYQPIHFKEIHITKELHPKEKELISQELKLHEELT